MKVECEICGGCGDLTDVDEDGEHVEICRGCGGSGFVEVKDSGKKKNLVDEEE